MKSESMNFGWKEAVWLALDDCWDEPCTKGVYVYVGEYMKLTEDQLKLDNQRVMQKYKNTVRNILNNFRSLSYPHPIIEGAKENRELKYGHYNWIGKCAEKEKRKEIRKKIEDGWHLIYILRDPTFL